MQEPRLIHISTEDGLTLPGYIYEAPKSKKAAIFLHGNGSASVFYKKNFQQEYAQSLHAKGISYLAFNNRGAHYIKSLRVRENGEEERKLFGTAFEKIKDCVKDIDGAIAFLKDLGYTELYLVGESTGANKICVYDYYKKNNPVAKYLLLGGGDDTGIYYDMLGKQRFYHLLHESEKKIKAHQGDELIAELLPDDFLSYTAFYDTCNPDGDYNTFPFHEALHQVKLSSKPLFRYFKAIKKPMLVVYGEQDEFAWGDVPKVVEELKKYQPTATYAISPGADHSFSDHQTEVGQLMAEWLL